MQTRYVHWRSPLVVTLILVLLIVAGSFFVTRQINLEEEATSFTHLADEAAELVHNLELNMGSDREKLQLIAEMLSDHSQDDTDMLEKLLGSYYGTGTFFSRLELLLPGDEVITANGTHEDVSGQLSFSSEAALGAHISDRELDLDGESYILRHFVPVESDGEVTAMLYGVIELGSLGGELPYTPYGGQAAVYVIDGATGDFLIDTWHNDPGGNIWELGERPLAPGYDHTQLQQGLIDGESNYVVFLSETTGAYLYFYYTPLEINQWRVALSVPEDLVFSGARSIRSLLNVLLILEGVFFFLYILWLISYVRRETGEKQRQLDALSYIYDVEKLLFNAHEHRENVPKALEVITRMLSARRAAFTMMTEDGPDLDYLWEKGGKSALGTALLQSAPALAAYFAAGHTEISAHTPQEVRAILPDAPVGLDDLAAIPVEDVGGTICGVLATSGLTRRAGCAAMLKSVGFSFSMLCSNTITYRTMQRRGERDAMTGLYNRNRYELDLPNIGSQCHSGLCCVYLDANGLHELNNDRGHEAGDRMLCSIANAIAARFGTQFAYRIGGDEFVVFCIDANEDNVAQHTQAMTASLERMGYHVSAGVAWSPAPLDNIEPLVKTAEEHMYAAKRAYYRDPEHDRRMR